MKVIQLHNQAPPYRPLTPLSNNQAPPYRPLTPLTTKYHHTVHSHPCRTTKHHHTVHSHPWQPSTTIPSTHTPVAQPSTTIPSTHTPVAQPSTTIPSTHTPVAQPSTTIPSTHATVTQQSYSTPISPVSILRDFNLYNNFYTYDEPAPSQQLGRIEAFLRTYQSEVFSRLDRLEAFVQSQRLHASHIHPLVCHYDHLWQMSMVNKCQQQLMQKSKVCLSIPNYRASASCFWTSEIDLYRRRNGSLHTDWMKGQWTKQTDAGLTGKMCLIEHLV